MRRTDAHPIPLDEEGATVWVFPDEALWCVTPDDIEPPPSPDPMSRLPEPPPRLSELWLYTTADCNLGCAHCFALSGTTRPSLGTLLARADEARKLGATTFYLTGGEPFMRDDIEELIASLASENTVVVLTNGTLVTAERLERLARLVDSERRNRIAFQVSLDGPRTVHDARRGAGAYAGALAGIEALVGFGRPPAISTALTAANLDGAPEVTRTVATVGCRVHHLFLPHVEGRLAASPEEVPTPHDLLVAIRACREVAAETGVILTNHATIAARVRTPGRRFDGCIGGCSLLAVAADGALYGCPTLVGRPTLGDPSDQTLARALDHGAPSALRGATLERRGSCASCEYRHFCGGGCAAHAYAAAGGFDEPDPYCAVYRGLIEDCIRMEARRLIEQADASVWEQDVMAPSMREDAIWERYRFSCT